LADSTSQLCHRVQSCLLHLVALKQLRIRLFTRGLLRGWELKCIENSMCETSLLHNRIASLSCKSIPRSLLSSVTRCLSSYLRPLQSCRFSRNTLPIMTMSCTYSHVLPDLRHVHTKYAAPRSTAVRVGYKPKPESFSEQVVRLMSSRPRPRDKVSHNLISSKLTTH
jgi:hypothetical protein